MNYSPFLSVALCFLPLGVPLSAAEPTVLIDTDFSNQTPGEEVTALKDQDVPLKFPSIVSMFPNSTSSIMIAKEAVGTLKPPFVVFQVGGRDENPDHTGNANLEWDLSREGLEEGSYELTAALTPLDSEFKGGRLLVQFEGDYEPLHPGLRPVQISFFGNRLIIIPHRIPFNAEETYEIKMHFNLSRREWSGSINGDEILPTTPFPPQMSAENAPHLILKGVTFGSSGGRGDRPDAHYAISRLTLKKLAE
jgi:hypothetical protein